MKKFVLKIMSAIFSIFVKYKVLKNFEKSFLFHVKSSLRYWDIQMLYFLFASLFPVNQKNNNTSISTLVNEKWISYLGVQKKFCFSFSVYP